MSVSYFPAKDINYFILLWYTYYMLEIYCVSIYIEWYVKFW